MLEQDLIICGDGLPRLTKLAASHDPTPKYFLGW